MEKLGNFANQLGVSMFGAATHNGLSGVLSEKAYQAVSGFARWIVELSDNAVRGDSVDTLRGMIRAMHYEEWLYEQSPSPKAAEMGMANISTLFRWVQDMLEGNELDAPMTMQEVVNRLTCAI